MTDEQTRIVTPGITAWEKLNANSIITPQTPQEANARAQVLAMLGTFFSGQELDEAIKNPSLIRQAIGRILIEEGRTLAREREIRQQTLATLSKAIVACLPKIEAADMDPSTFYYRGTLLHRLRLKFIGDFATGEAVFFDNTRRSYTEVLDFARDKEPSVAIYYALNGCGNDIKDAPEREDPVVIAFRKYEIPENSVRPDTTEDLIIKIKALVGLRCRIFRCN